MPETQWQYETAVDIDQPLAERLRHFPREPDMLMYGLRSAAAITLRTWLKIYHRFKIEGCENLPAEGSFIMVANHTSHLDALCLLSALPHSKLHRAFPAAAQDYFFVSLPRIACAAVLINAIPFARQVHIRQSLKLCRQLLANPGNILILFPEGTRSATGEMRDFRPGVGSLAAGLEAPVVPCALKGCFSAWPRGGIMPLPRPLRLIIGKPLSFRDRPGGTESAHKISQELRVAVQELLCK